MLPFDDRPHRQASSGDILSAVRALNAPPLPAVAPDPSPQASATCARELLPAARQLALSMSQRPAAGRGFPGPCLTRPRRGAAPAPAPERSGALKRSSAVHAPSGSESSALARRIALASPPVPRGPGRRHLPPRLSSAGPQAHGGGQRAVGGGASDDRRRLRMLLVAVCRGARAARESR